MDDNLVAMSNTKADFYRTDLIDNGYLILTDTYRPFPEDTEDELLGVMTTMVSYLGNNWFLRQGYIQLGEEDSSKEERDFIEDHMGGKFILIDIVDYSTGLKDYYHVLMRSDRYNSKTKINRSNEKLVPDMVANRYNESATRDIADYLNNSLEESIGGKIAYYPPSIPVGALPKDGMSIVYYYYFPYDNQPERYIISYAMMDENANIYHPPENVFMPILCGWRGSSDKRPDMIYPLGMWKYLMKTIELRPSRKIPTNTVITIAYSNGVLIAAEYSRKEGSMRCIMVLLI